MQRQFQQNQNNNNQQKQKANVYTIDTINMTEIIKMSYAASIELKSVKGTVYRIKMKRIAFDFGAIKSIISEKIARKRNLKINIYRTLVRLADDIIVRVIWITDPLFKIKIKGDEFTLSLLIFEHKVYNVFLGLYCVKIADLGIILHRNALFFFLLLAPRGA